MTEGVWRKPAARAGWACVFMQPSDQNPCARLAGYIVERTTGQSLDTYTERRIFKPLGMNSVVLFTNTSGAETEKAYVAILKALFEHAEALRQGHHE